MFYHNTNQKKRHGSLLMANQIEEKLKEAVEKSEEKHGETAQSARLKKLLARKKNLQRRKHNTNRRNRT